MHSGLQGGRIPTRRSSFRAASATLAVGALSSSLIIGGIAAAVSNHKVKHVVLTTLTTKYGTILVSGKTVYTLKASKVSCTTRCLKVWPEVLLPKGVTTATAGPGVNAASIGTVKHRGGARQVTYSGKPLYWFIGDTAPGQVNGNITDKWGAWSVVVMVKPAGAAPSTASTVPQTTTSSTPHSASTPSTMSPNPSSSSNTPATAPPATTPRRAGHDSADGAADHDSADHHTDDLAAGHDDDVSRRGRGWFLTLPPGSYGVLSRSGFTEGSTG